ncbi:TPA: hypothetical protein J1431_004485 [Escherichia coli]|nr:hypothetical protein [Escherichia coli]EKG7814473.1 hypothetical protein [Escherichia coli]HBA7146763.1 hypothetical protein [Escherichia coli]HBA9701450.1 hypothetical protein [Escherichia coli]HBA9837686.1 hypothetical protein [Escherichia coli]
MFFKGFLSSVKEKVLSVKEKVLSVKKSVMSFFVAPLVLASGSALAAGATTTTTAIDFSSLQTAINFTSVIGIILAVGAAAVGVYICYAGVSMVLKSIKKAS